MAIEISESPVLDKTLELCQAILDYPGMQSIRQRIDTFMADGKSRAQYEDLVAKGQALQEKQQVSALTGEEIDEFERQRKALFENPVAREFMGAQQDMQNLQQTIQRYITRTFELGRLPTEEDLSSCCESGCSCGH